MPTLAEQVAALEAERDASDNRRHELAGLLQDARAALAAAESRLADVQAERDRLVVQHREALEREDHYRSRLASARVEGARDKRERARDVLELCAKYFDGDENAPIIAHRVRAFRDREYPAPAAPAGEPTRKPWPSVVGWPYFCDKCGEKGECFTGCGLAECDAVAIRESRPAPTPESGVLEFEMWGTTRNEWVRVTLTPEDCRRIVALGSRPTQTAEG